MIDNIATQVQSLERNPNFVRVEVAALGPANLDQMMRQRAKARALLVAGLGEASYETIKDVAVGDIKRLTKITDTASGDEVEFDRVPVLDGLLQRKIYTVRVNR